MTSEENTDVDPEEEKSLFARMQRILFDIMLTTDGRTTDMLETLMGEKMSVLVIRQEQISEEQAAHLGALSGGPYYVRESILFGENSKVVVSHNIVLVCAKYVPPPMFEALASKQEGIGKTIGALGLKTSRKLADFGWRKEEEAADLFGRPIKLGFSLMDGKAPFKKYSIIFDAMPGIHLLEYFNPDIVYYRFRQGNVNKGREN